MGGAFNVNTLATSVAMIGAGTLALNGNFTAGGNGSSSLDTSTVDFSGLSNFVYNAAAGTIALGNATHSAVNFILAATNNITAATINDNTPNTRNSATG